MFYMALSIVSELGNILKFFFRSYDLQTFLVISPICHNLDNKHSLNIRRDGIKVSVEFQSGAVYFIIFLTDVH